MASKIIRRIICTKKAPNPVGSYNQAVVVDKTMYLSGQIGLTQEGTMVPGGVVNETHQVLKNLQAVLTEAGIDLGNVVKTTVYLNDINDFDAVNGVYQQYFTSKFPARAAFQAGALPKNANVEIEAIAVIGQIEDV